MFFLPFLNLITTQKYFFVQSAVCYTDSATLGRAGYFEMESKGNSRKAKSKEKNLFFSFVWGKNLWKKVKSLRRELCKTHEYSRNGDAKWRELRLPPKLKWSEFSAIGASLFMVFIGLNVISEISSKKWLFEELYSFHFLDHFTLDSKFGYGSLLLILFGVFFWKWGWHHSKVHHERLEDRSDVESIIDEAKRYVLKGDGPIENLQILINNLEDLQPEGWVDYQILPIKQEIVNFLSEEDLIARARVKLGDLEEYNEKDDFADDKYFSDHKKRINRLIDWIKDTDKAEKKDSNVASLKAQVKNLWEALVYYEATWAEGSEIIRALIICNSFAIPILLLMGILPIFDGVFHPLGVYNWMFLGAAGALTPVILKIHRSKTEEVGDTQGKNELWRMFMGGVLGLTAGLLAFSIMQAKIFNSTFNFNPDSNIEGWAVVGVSTLISFVAGFSFEKFFTYVKSTI